MQEFVCQVISDREVNLDNTKEIEVCKKEVDAILNQNKSIVFIEIYEDKCIVWFDDLSNVPIDVSWLMNVLKIKSRIVSSLCRKYVTQNDFTGMETSDEKYVFIVEA